MQKEFTITVDENTEVGELTDHFAEVIDTYIICHCSAVNAADIGLDYRCGSAFIPPSMDAVIVKDSHLRTYRYYGGFEYIDEEHVTKLGEYTIFSEESNRVYDCLRTFEAKENQEENEDV